uniref:Transposase n=1 Tax=Echinococcus granulosus TaxID=6210 RepID=A0A068WM12_ECHGR|nr:hypothetical protein EgrG_000153800 [Echinococcus granulosus]
MNWRRLQSNAEYNEVVVITQNLCKLIWTQQAEARMLIATVNVSMPHICVCSRC